MTNDNVISLLKLFDEICLKHDLFYSLARDAAFSIYKQDAFLASAKNIDVFMRIEDYETLKNYYPQFFVDSLSDSNYKILKPRFLSDNNNFKTADIYISILLLVPTKIIKIGNFDNLYFKLSRVWSRYQQDKSVFTWRFKLVKWFFLLFKKHWVPMNYKYVYELLYDREFEGYYSISSPKELRNVNWITHLTFTTHRYQYGGNYFNLLNEFKLHFHNYFGTDWESIEYDQVRK
ncbi:hypothetical protein ACA758_05210 [Mycoplasmopsis agassizii]|uniref:hypothetical protein n=1 Tax=Mycoplasmopsis agassizii TaxID=33922 RepID=UPI003529C7D4